MASVKVPEFEKRYPDPNKFGVIPAYGFFIRHVENVKMNDVTISFLNNDYRAPFILDEVTNASFQNIEAQKIQGIPAFILDNVTDFTIKNSAGVKDIQIKKVNHQSL